MNFLESLSLFGGIANLLLAVLVLSRGWGNRAHQVYFFLGLAIGIWNIGTSRMFRVQTPEEALYYARLLQFGVIFTPALLFHLSILIADLRYRKFMGLVYAWAGLLALGNALGFFVQSVRHTGYAWYSVPGPLFWVFCLGFSLTILAVVVLFKKRSMLPPLHRTRLTPLLIAQIALAVLGANDLLPILGIDHYFFTSVQIVPLGGIAAVCYGLLTAYSVLQHQILDARISLGRTAAHVLRALFLTVAAGVLLYVLQALFPGRLVPVGMVAFFVSALLGSYIFPRLFGKGTEVFERRLLGDRFEYHDKVRDFIAGMVYETEPENLLDGVEALLSKEVGLQEFQLALFDEVGRIFTVVRPVQDGAEKIQLPLSPGSALFRLPAEAGMGYLGVGLSYGSPAVEGLEKQALEDLAGMRFEICFPLLSGNAPMGLLLLGAKRREERYTNEDLELLEALGKNLSLVLGQMRLRKQVLLAQEMDLLGRMSRGIAHDLNNLITPASTFLQLASQGRLDKEAEDELLPVASRNVETMRAYIREALFFSDQNKPTLTSANLRMVAERALDLADTQLQRKRMRGTVECEGDILVRCDALLLQRALSNLISNAIDASPEGSAVSISLQRLAGTGAGGDWVRVQVIDSGEGISPEVLGKIGTPYFTTKDTGDETRGFGLGLSICRRIVHLHRGHLAIMSESGKGTTAQLDLPGVLTGNEDSQLDL